MKTPRHASITCVIVLDNGEEFTARFAAETQLFKGRVIQPAQQVLNAQISRFQERLAVVGFITDEGVQYLPHRISKISWA